MLQVKCRSSPRSRRGTVHANSAGLAYSLAEAASCWGSLVKREDPPPPSTVLLMEGGNEEEEDLVPKCPGGCFGRLLPMFYPAISRRLDN